MGATTQREYGDTGNLGLAISEESLSGIDIETYRLDAAI